MMRDLLESDKIRFIISGTINTGLTLVVFWGLTYLGLHYQAANIIAYLSGIIVTYFLQTLFVFRTPVHVRTFLQFPIVYIVQYALGAMLLWFLIEYVVISQQIAPIIVIVLLMPLTYIMSRFILRSRVSPLSQRDVS